MVVYYDGSKGEILLIKYYKKFFYDLKKYRYYLAYAVKSSLKAELSNTILGYLWWLFEPLLHMLIYTFLVTVIFKRGDAVFPVYVFCALLPWKVASNTMQRSTHCVRDNANLIKQVYIPHFLLSLIILLTNTIKFFVGLILLAVMVYAFHLKLSWHVIEFIPLYIVFFFFYWSISLLLTHIGVLFDDMKNLIGYVIMFWFFASPGMWYLNLLPENFSKIIWFNPNVTFFMGMRDTFMQKSSPNYFWIGIWFLVSFSILLIAIPLLYSSEKNYSKVI